MCKSTLKRIHWLSSANYCFGLAAFGSTLPRGCRKPRSIASRLEWCSCDAHDLGLVAVGASSAVTGWRRLTVAPQICPRSALPRDGFTIACSG